MSEKAIQTEIIKYLQSLGWKVIKTVVLSKSGDADLICCDTKGMFWAIEVKDLKEKPRPLQINKLVEIQRVGGNACSVTSLSQLKDYIQDGVPNLYKTEPIFHL
jgi:Holliday junction resolvase